MADPRLNSVHLESARRQDYRRAREDLLRAQGAHTLFASHDVDDAGMGHTVIHPGEGRAVRELPCWLSDGEFIYPLQVGVNTLGRCHENDVVVDDAYASRRHCAILIHAADSAELHDTASKNGTYLNGSRLSAPALLKSGDEIRISEHPFILLTRSGDADALSPQATLSN
jgi:hypothetical protein